MIDLDNADLSILAPKVSEFVNKKTFGGKQWEIFDSPRKICFPNESLARKRSTYLCKE